ncbi:AsmA protein [Pseudorhizobium tarimense]|uniref:AsmA protein n=1 Tax=Pseudorhizobium tarimense TaxID=1079109 RepID=A0ABV2HAS0_9HYPH|nr:AsmA family protein [Pseudorhizobium tarimense]MCJ8520809.1 AsmA family protein [Pseudorhizobium tarimense]
MSAARRRIAGLFRPTSPRAQGITRALMWAIAILVLLSVLFRLAAPFLIQTAIVRGGIERAIAQWTGHDVTIEGNTTISFWPQPRIQVEGITVSKPSEDGVRLLSRTARLSAEFSLYQALRGRARFEDFRLINPEIFVIRDRDGRLEWTNDGQLSAAIRSVAASGGPPDPNLDVRVGDIAIENGRIEVEDLSTGKTWRVTRINGNIRWPRLSDPARAQLTAQVAGQAVELGFSSPEPLLLLAGSTAPLEGSVTSALVSARFSGSANSAEFGFVSGRLELSAPDVPTLGEWAGLSTSGLSAIHQVDLTADLLTAEGTVRFNQMQLSLNGSSGSGVVDLSIPDTGSPRLTGTVALQRFDLLPAAETVAADPPGDVGDAIAPLLDLDLRVSGEEVTAGPLNLSDVAISIMSRTDEARIDILDGTVAGGRLTGQLVGSDGNLSTGGTARLSIRNAELGEIWRSLNLQGPLPQATGSVEATVNFDGRPSWESLVFGRGDLRVISGPGVLQDVSPQVILDRIGTRNYSPLRNPGGEDFDYSTLELDTLLERGLAKIQSASVLSDGISVELSGIVSYRDGGLALSARLLQPELNATPEEIFIGGIWPDPIAIKVP